MDDLQNQISDIAIEVFVDERSVIPGQALRIEISKAIMNCDLFVVLWSRNAEASEWVSQEIGVAHAHHKNILPLVLSEGLQLPGFIQELKYLPVWKDRQKSLVEARDIVLKLFQEKKEKTQRQKRKDNLVLIGLGAFLLWAFSQE